MHLFTSAKPKFRFRKLNEVETVDVKHFEKYLGLVTNWFTDEWGYIHDKGKNPEQVIQERKKYLRENKDKIHMVFYENLVVGAFRIENKEFDEAFLRRDLIKTNEIWFIYVDPTYRGLGAGRQMVQEIKRLSKDEMSAAMVLLETLKPGLNHLYMSEEGKIICENSIEKNPTDVLRINL